MILCSEGAKVSHHRKPGWLNGLLRLFQSITSGFSKTPPQSHSQPSPTSSCLQAILRVCENCNARHNNISSQIFNIEMRQFFTALTDESVHYN